MERTSREQTVCLIATTGFIAAGISVVLPWCNAAGDVDLAYYMPGDFGELSSQIQLGFAAWMALGWFFFVSAAYGWRGGRLLFGYLAIAVSLATVAYFRVKVENAMTESSPLITPDIIIVGTGWYVALSAAAITTIGVFADLWFTVSTPKPERAPPPLGPD